MSNSSQYQNAGVSVETGDALVDWLQDSENKKQKYADRILSGIGGFASLFNIQFPEIKKPCLITCTDGVGTKVKLAAQFNRYEGIGQDLVAMCANDLICTGGIPLLFLDYYAVGKLDLQNAKSFLTSVRKACQESQMLLVGGETAEMPGVYHNSDFDCAGFAVGIVDQDKVIGPQKVKTGDVLIGIASSGFHSNGYSLLRKVFANQEKEFLDLLLAPTRLYVDLMMEILKNKIEVHAAAHVTGGGMDNIPRVVPPGKIAQLTEWEFPECFKEVQKRTQMSKKEMLHTLNCGLGFVLIVPEGSTDAVHKIAAELNHKSWNLGFIQDATGDADWQMENVK